MTVRVDELSSDVVVEPEVAGTEDRTGPARHDSPWAEADQYRALRERWARDLLRTRSEGFDD